MATHEIPEQKPLPPSSGEMPSNPVQGRIIGHKDCPYCQGTGKVTIIEVNAAAQLRTAARCYHSG